MMPSRKEWQCEVCGSEDLDVKAWYNLKQRQAVQDGDYAGPGWCRECEKSTLVVWADKRRQA